MPASAFIHIYSNGEVWFGNQADQAATGKTLVTCIRVNPDASFQKVATLTGSGNSSASALADSLGKGTGASGSKFTQKELT